MASSEKQKKVKALIAGINKKYNKQVIAKVSDIEDELRVTFIPTKSLKLNNLMGGGAARGRITEFFGPTGSGKTFTCYEIIGESMKQDPEALWGWFETEGSFDWEVAERCGIDPDRLIFWEMSDEGAESGLDILESIIRQMGKDLTGVIVNSVAGLTPRKELDSLMEKQDMGTMAKMMSKLMRKITAIVNKNKIAIIFINQVRDKIDLYGGSVTTGGRALAFFASQRIEFKKRKTEAADGVKEEEYIKIQIKAHKNRFAKGNPFKTTEMFGRYGHGTDVVMEILQLSVDQGIITKGAGGRYSYITDGGEELKWHGNKKLLDFVSENEWFADEIRGKILASDDASIGIQSLSADEISAIEAEDLKAQEEMSSILQEENEEETA